MEKTLGGVREMSGRKWAAFSQLVEATEAMATERKPEISTVSLGGDPREEAYEQEVRVP
jgi:hypothetical protein